MNTIEKLIIFEMANNHQGSVDHGLRIIEELAKIHDKYAVNGAVKFQFRDLDTFIRPDYRGRTDVKQVKRFNDTRISLDDFDRMFTAVREAGMQIVITPFDETSVDNAVTMGVDILKVASASVTDWPLLEKIAAANHPVIFSTGGATITEIDRTYSFFSHRIERLGLLHCVSIYPTPRSRLHLQLVRRYGYRYPKAVVGYSGHEDPGDPVPAAIATSMGARILERHVGLPTDEIKLNSYSMNPKQTANWVSTIVETWETINDGNEKLVTQEERDTLLDLSRGVFAGHAIKKNCSIGTNDTFFAFPAEKGQLPSGAFGRKRVAFTSTRDYKTDEAITEPVPEVDTIELARDLVHEALGMLREAHITVGEEYSVELSHHFGLENFKSTGAVIFNLINREYCKKLMVMVPGQSHPIHRHILKEETFHVLWGGMKVELNGKTRHLTTGDFCLVEREVWHGFSTETGVIFEEVSTTHRRGDSEYTDPEIQRLDPMERKTIIEEL